MLQKGEIIYWSRVISSADYFEIHELKIRTVTDEYFVAFDIDKRGTKQAFLFYYNDLEKIIFKNRKDAVKKLKELRKAYYK